MIITRAPFRVSLCGGGSDIQSYYKHHGGCVISTSINKYIYVTIHPFFNDDAILLKYSSTEIAKTTSDIKHPIIRTVLERENITGIEITSIADIPAGTGLGSSSAFTVALLSAVNAYKGKYVSKERLASEACCVEIDVLKSPIGKQDQYASAYGGLNMIRFNKNESVSVEPVIMKPSTYKQLQNNLMMFYTGDVRSANKILSEQNENMSDNTKVQSMQQICGLTEKMYEALSCNDLSSFGRILDESWQLKRTLASDISNPQIDYYYEQAMKNGALGGKLLGAGGGGFLLFYCEKENQNALRASLPLKELPVAFDNSGVNVIFVGDKYWD